jgi:hypothetical protein
MKWSASLVARAGFQEDAPILFHRADPTLGDLRVLVDAATGYTDCPDQLAIDHNGNAACIGHDTREPQDAQVVTPAARAS